MQLSSGGTTPAYWYTTTANTTTIAINGPSAISVTPQRPTFKGPLEWLREQVDEVCRLAREP